MNRICARYSVCCRSSSLLRKNPLTGWSSSTKPISSSSSSNLIKVFISKIHHHTIIYPCPPPQIPEYHNVRKFGGVASQCDDSLKIEIQEVQAKESDVPFIEDNFGYDDGTFLHAVEDLVQQFNTLMEKCGLQILDDGEKDDKDYPPHLQQLREEIQDLVQSVDMTVASEDFESVGDIYRCCDYSEENYECMLKYPEILASLQKMKIKSSLMRELISYRSPPQIPGNHNFKKFREGKAVCVFGNNDYLKNEIQNVKDEQIRAQGKVETGNGPPLDVVKVLADKFNALMETFGLATLDDDENNGVYQPRPKGFRVKIHYLIESVDMTVAFGEYVAAGGSRSWYPFMDNYRCMRTYEEILASLRQMQIRRRRLIN